MKTFHRDRVIAVDGQETYLLSHFVCDSGIALETSGPETIYLHEHRATEWNGAELNLNVHNPVQVCAQVDCTHIVGYLARMTIYLRRRPNDEFWDVWHLFGGTTEEHLPEWAPNRNVAKDIATRALYDAWRRANPSKAFRVKPPRIKWSYSRLRHIEMPVKELPNDTGYNGVEGNITPN